MKYRLKMDQADLEQMKKLVLSDLPKEAGAFALAGIGVYREGRDILVRRPLAVPNHLFRIQHEQHLEIAPEAVNGLAALCDANGLGAVVCHSHPGEIPYSATDDHGEDRLFRSLRPFLPEGAPTASLLFTPKHIHGRIWLPGSTRPKEISEIIVVGRNLRRYRGGEIWMGRGQGNDEIYDRQVRAFGEDGQALIAEMKVAIVGIGGTGSPTAEQLVRLGVRDIILIDPDVVSPSNLTRMYGTFARPRRRLLGWWRRGSRTKVDIVAEHLRRIRPKIRVQTAVGNVVQHDIATLLLDRDVIFLCTDEHWGRSIVNEIAYQYLIPTLNLGMRIRSTDGRITAASGSVDVLRPGIACLWCGQSLSAARIATESLPEGLREELQEEGYVEDVHSPAPSVVSMTTTLSGLAVTQFLQFVTDFMGVKGEVHRLRYNMLEGTVRRGVTQIATPCVCGQVRGFGDLRPLSTLASP